MYSQANLLVIWAGLGMSPWRVKLIGVVAGVAYIGNLVGISFRKLTMASSLLVYIPDSSLTMLLLVTMLLLIVRLFRFAIGSDHLPVTSADHVQFSIRHLMNLTFVIACLLTIGKAVQPYFPPGKWLIKPLLLAVTFGLVGVIPVWFVLATKRPVLLGVGLVAVGACAGFCLASIDNFRNVGLWMTAATVEAMVVVLSLLIVRFCGYRLLRRPSRRQKEKLV